MIRAVVLAAVLLIPATGIAQPPGLRDPNWPCQQIKVPELSLASAWSGPAVDTGDTTWHDNPAVVDLVEKIAPRRLPLDQAQTLIDEFAHNAGPKKQPELLQVVAGVFSLLDTEHASVLAGLDRFGARQKQLADQIRNDNENLHNLQSATSSDPNAVQHMTQQVTWEAELFQDRRQALGFACDVPTKIEQRLFALSRQIQKNLE